MAENERITNQNQTDQHIHSQTVSQSMGWLCGRQKVAAQHAMDSITRSTIWKLTSQEQHMEIEADGSMTAARPEPCLTSHH